MAQMKRYGAVIWTPLNVYDNSKVNESVASCVVLRTKTERLSSLINSWGPDDFASILVNAKWLVIIGGESTQKIDDGQKQLKK
jgi:hypothetical protein